MENPKLRIESDGRITEVYIDGKKVNRATMADFHFHAEPFDVKFTYEKYATDKSGKIKIENNETVREIHEMKFEKEKS